MRQFQRIFIAFLLWAVAALAQAIPGRYIVELTGGPLGAEVRTRGRIALGARVSQIRAEQTRARTLVERNNGKVVSTVDSVMNALLVTIPDADSAALATLPGVKAVYPVFEYTANLDHALAIHHVPDAWARIGGKDKAGVGIKIAILDTGISPNHPGFQDATLRPPTGFPLASSTANRALTNNKIIVARSYEDIYEESDPDDITDRYGHGTATAMCAAGVTNTGPYATITGVAPKAWLGVYKISPANSGSAAGDVILKAMDDALADGMDVINLSFGSPFQFGSGPDLLPGVAIDRLAQFGVVMVVSAGNSGPGLNTMGDYASSNSVITAGAMQSDRLFSGRVSAGGTSYQATPTTGPVPGPITATVFDAAIVDPTGFLCSPLPAGRASGQIVLIQRGTCSFEQKVIDAQAGGAVAVVLYNNTAGTLNATIGAATLPTVFLTTDDGSSLKSMIARAPGTLVTVAFNGITAPESPNLLASFTSRGPSFDYSIKPDLVAVGTDVYTAAEKVDPTGGIYSENGYAVVQGTSFSSPITAGAVAVLRGARPGLSVAQYRSLIINSASPLIRDDGWVERVQQAGAGVLNLDAALRSNITALPTSLTYGVGTGTLGGAITGDLDQLTLTNVGKTADVFHLSAAPFDYAPPLQFSQDPTDENPASTLDLTLAPGQSKTVYAFWVANRLVAGEYQGDIVVQSGSSQALVPYWYGVPNLRPSSAFILNPAPASARRGSVIRVYVRVTDSVGYAITDSTQLGFRGSAIGGGTVVLSPTIYFPNLRALDLTLGATPGTNTYTITFGTMAPLQIAIAGT